MFNPIRASRPLNNNNDNKTDIEFSDELEKIADKCDFCSPLSNTAVGMNM